MIYYATDNRTEIDNNIKRQIRPIAIGKKKCLFADSDNGGHHATALNPLQNIAKLNAVNPERYQCQPHHDQIHLKRLAIETFGHKQINVSKVYMGNSGFKNPRDLKV